MILAKVFFPLIPTHFSLLPFRLQKLDIQILRTGSRRANSIHRSDVSILHQVLVGLLQFD